MTLIHLDELKMTDQRESDSLGKFTGKAKSYDRARPRYPLAALDFIASHCRLNKHSLLVDVGCGTGIASRAFAEAGFTVIGVEPNDDMRAQAEAVNLGLTYLAPEYRCGQAESTGLADAKADLVLSAQAFHWFNAGAALQEFSRILKDEGWVALMWNEYDRGYLFTKHYSDLILTLPGARQIQAHRQLAGEPLIKSLLFQMAERHIFPNQQSLDEGELLARALSDTSAPSKQAFIDRFTETIQSLFNQYQDSGKVSLHYQTSVYVAQKASGSKSG